MPDTRRSRLAKAKQVSVSAGKAKAKKKAAVNSKDQTDPAPEETEETAYDRIYRKWQAGKRKTTEAEPSTSQNTKKAKTKIKAGKVSVVDEDNFMELSVEDEANKQFPSQSEEEKSDDDDFQIKLKTIQTLKKFKSITMRPLRRKLELSLNAPVQRGH